MAEGQGAVGVSAKYTNCVVCGWVGPPDAFKQGPLYARLGYSFEPREGQMVRVPSPIVTRCRDGRACFERSLEQGAGEMLGWLEVEQVAEAAAQHKLDEAAFVALGPLLGSP